jgi:GABA permease
MRYLVVANQTLGGEGLEARLRECMAAGPCSFYMVVPATPAGDHATWTEGEARTLAQARLDEVLGRFGTLDAEMDGEVGDARPLLAIGDVMRHADFDEIILSTLQAGASRWLRMDLPHRVERQFGLPVTLVEDDRVPIETGSGASAN